MKKLVFVLLFATGLAGAIERHADGSLTITKEEEEALVAEFNRLDAESAELKGRLGRAVEMIRQQEKKIESLGKPGACI